MKIHKLKRVPS